MTTPACWSGSASNSARPACRSPRSPRSCGRCCAATDRRPRRVRRRVRPPAAGAGLPGRCHRARRRTPSDAPRGYLFDLVAQLFGRLAAARPLIVAIEDLHWADRSTRDLIGFLVRAGHPGPLLLICTYRTDELHRGHPLRPFLAELDRARGVERVELSRLERDGTGAVLAGLLGAEPAARAVDDIHDRTQGNPLFIEELAAAGSPIGCAALPETLRDLLLARVDRLPESAQRVLRIAAAGGNRLAHQLLAEVAGLPEAELDDAVRAAVAAQLLVADPDGDYEFRHALVREAVHDELLPGEHARLHARFAAAIEAQPHLVAAGRAPAEIAHHWYAAHDHPRALVAARVTPAPPPTGTRTPSRPGCWNGCWNCGSWCPTPPTGSAWTTSRCWRRRSARRPPPVTTSVP
ncbi:ATP-binding protein [Verrucosispora sioxanthis]|uniref:ATP-binding protein n=1 Tax=Verrucosispora sioxanthis TaxID=2499994 RepID=UPI001AA04873|nr:AAA family ATPase [Verrucosispora sioxanthis]